MQLLMKFWLNILVFKKLLLNPMHDLHENKSTQSRERDRERGRESREGERGRRREEGESLCGMEAKAPKSNARANMEATPWLAIGSQDSLCLCGSGMCV
jgi:hypothetical protein